MANTTLNRLRTPIIKPRTQGGTFYTFGSAMEDIGLNINNTGNKISLSHYILLDIPDMDKFIDVSVRNRYNPSDEHAGDLIFADFFQNAILNMETVVRDQSDYNYSLSKTVSERVFWKWLFKHKPMDAFVNTNDGYIYEKDDSSYQPIAKAFGTIISGSQRTDSYGIYNETFVQIPSSYGQMKVLFKTVNDSNYKEGGEYDGSNGEIIQDVSTYEYDNTVDKKLYSTGISALAQFDDYTDKKYIADSSRSSIEAVLDINELREHYDSSLMTIDDIGFGEVEPNKDSFPFNAILVYYSIFDPAGINVIATNAFGLYILDNATQTSPGVYSFPTLLKKRTTPADAGTSFSFRLNIKPTSAYSGNITVSDNSTSAFTSATDFNDVVKNLSTCVEILKNNARFLSEISTENHDLKKRLAETIDQVNDIKATVNNIRTDASVYSQLAVGSLLAENTVADNSFYNAKNVAAQILNAITVKFDNNNKFSIDINYGSLDTDATRIANKVFNTSINGTTYYNESMLLALLLASRSSSITVKPRNIINS